MRRVIMNIRFQNNINYLLPLTKQTLWAVLKHPRIYINDVLMDNHPATIDWSILSLCVLLILELKKNDGSSAEAAGHHQIYQSLPWLDGKSSSSMIFKLKPPDLWIFPYIFFPMIFPWKKSHSSWFLHAQGLLSRGGGATCGTQGLRMRHKIMMV